MSRIRNHLSIWPWVHFTAFAVCSCVAADRAVIAADTPDTSPDVSPYVGTLSCSSVSCHGRTEARRGAGSAARNEFVTWSHFDPHARAAATIASPAFHEILERLGAVRDGAWNLAVYARCAQCHDPQHESLAPPTATVPRTHLASDNINPRGIGCESCHGPAEKWLAKHFERNVTRDDLSALGMVRTKDLATRGGMCAECHVGSASRDMNHDMIAAGHPALRFELVTYHDQLAKHWDDAGERLATPEFTAQLWAAGQLADASATLQLSGARAARAATKSAAASADHPAAADTLGLVPVWPEFAEYNCLSCHQPLRPSSIVNAPPRARSRVGLPAWSDWHFALTDSLLTQLALSDTRPPPAPQPSLPSSLRQLRERMATAPSLGDNSNLSPFADDIVNALTAAQTHLQSCGQNRSTVPFTSRQLVQLVRNFANEPRDWEATCQLFLALRAATRAYRDDVRILAHRDQISREEETQRLTACDADGSRLAAIQRSLSFQNHHDWPRALDVMATAADQNPKPRGESGPTADLTLAQIADEITLLAARLEQRAEQLPSLAGR